MALTIKVKGRRLLEKKIGKLKTPKWTALMKELAQQAQRDALERIDTTKLDPDGEKWAPWSESYRAPHFPGHTLLKRTRLMRNSIRAQWGPLRGRVNVPNVPYAADVQASRPFLGYGKDSLKTAHKIAVNFLRQRAAR